MVRINLLPAEIVERRKYERYYPYVFIVGGVLLAIVLVTSFALTMFTSQRTEQLQQAEETVNSLNQQSAALAIFEEQQQALAERQNVASQALAGRGDMGKLMEEISLVLPEPLWTQSMVLDEEKGLELQGFTPDSEGTKISEGYKSVAAGLVRINSLDALNDVWLTTAASEDYSEFQGSSAGGSAATVAWELTAKIVKPADDSAPSAVPAPPSTAGQ
jgi:Tfp pilus assembly protein PilN